MGHYVKLYPDVYTAPPTHTLSDGEIKTVSLEMGCRSIFTQLISPEIPDSKAPLLILSEHVMAVLTPMSPVSSPALGCSVVSHQEQTSVVRGG